MKEEIERIIKNTALNTMIVCTVLCRGPLPQLLPRVRRSRGVQSRRMMLAEDHSNRLKIVVSISVSKHIGNRAESEPLDRRPSSDGLMD